MGFVWQSQSNEDVILCNTCYHSDKGDVTQAFIRIDYPGHVGYVFDNKNLDNECSLHDAFLESHSSGTLKIEILERQIT